MKQNRRFSVWCGTVLIQLVFGLVVWAHPGSGIAVDNTGTVYFTDTGAGVWKLDRDGKLELISTTAYHWLGLDETGAFASTSEQFGQWFERVTPERAVPTIIVCSDYPMAIGNDGNLYYADTREFPPQIMKRTPRGKESIVAEMTEESPTVGEGGPGRYVQGFAPAPDGSHYVLEAAATVEHVSIRQVQTDGTLKSVARSFVPVELKFEDGGPAVAPSSVPAGEPVPRISWTYCRGLAVDEDGTIYVAANAARAVLAIDPKGGVRIVLRSEEPWGPTDVTVRHGELYVLEYDQTGEDRVHWIPRVRRMDTDGIIHTLATITRD